MSEIIKQERVFTITLTENEVRFLEAKLELSTEEKGESDYTNVMRRGLYAFFHSFNLNTGVR